MQDDGLKLRRVLSFPAAYQFAQALIGGRDPYGYLADTYLKPEPGSAVLDIGCGPARVRNALGDVNYVGFDPSAKYVLAARRRFGSRGTFHIAGVDDAWALAPSASFDLCLALGVAHHLDDKLAEKVFELARHALRPGGRLVTTDPCFSPQQSRLARMMVSLDRGAHVRTTPDYKRLARRWFDDVRTEERHDLTRLPFSHTIMTCR